MIYKENLSSPPLLVCTGKPRGQELIISGVTFAGLIYLAGQNSGTRSFLRSKSRAYSSLDDESDFGSAVLR